MVATQPPMHLSGRCVCPSDPQFVEEKGIRTEDLVIGALESAFQECVSVTFGWGRREGFTPRDLRDSGLGGVPDQKYLGASVTQVCNNLLVAELLSHV